MSEEHTVAIVSFDGALKREVRRIREKLKKVDQISDFRIDIEISGRTNDGEVMIVYKIGSSYASAGTAVAGDKLEAVAEEYMRRCGWNAAHAAKALSYEKVPSDDTAPL